MLHSRAVAHPKAGCWQREEERFQLCGPRISGAITLDAPAPGIVGVHLDRRPVCANLLALDGLVHRGHGGVETLAITPPLENEAVVRGTELVASFLPGPGQLRVTAYWRVGGEASGEDPWVEVEALVQTDDRFEAVELLTRTELEADGVLSLRGPLTAAYWQAPSPDTSGGTLVLPRDAAAAALTYDGRHDDLSGLRTEPTGAWPLVLFRLPGAEWTYCEMASPLDAGRVFLRASQTSGNRWIVRMALFGRDLEKGVILRGRVRGVWLDRRQDTERALGIYQVFLAQPPHLAA